MKHGSTRPGEPGSTYHHKNLRAALIDAALIVVDAEGPEGLTLSGLARQVGVSQAASYRHFADRAALLEAVAVEGFQALIAEMEGADPAPPHLPRMAEIYVAFGRSHPGLYELMFASRILREAGEESALGRAAAASFAQLLEAVEPGRIDRRLRALRIWAGLHGLVMLLGRGLPFGAVRGEVEVERLISAIIGEP